MRVDQTKGTIVFTYYAWNKPATLKYRKYLKVARLPIFTRDKADEATKKTYAAIASKFGMAPNSFKGMANSPVALNAYLKLDEMIAGGSFFPCRTRYRTHDGQRVQQVRLLRGRAYGQPAGQTGEQGRCAVNSQEKSYRSQARDAARVYLLSIKK